MIIIDRHIDAYIKEILHYLPLWERHRARVYFRERIESYLDYLCEGERPTLRDLRKIKRFLGNPKSVAKTYREDLQKSRQRTSAASDRRVTRRTSAGSPDRGARNTAGFRPSHHPAAQNASAANVRRAGNDTKKSGTLLDTVYDTIMQFLDNVNGIQLEEQLGTVIKVITGIAVLCAAFGLVSFVSSGAHPLLFVFGLITACGMSAVRVFLPSSEVHEKKDPSVFLPDDAINGSVYRSDVYRSVSK